METVSEIIEKVSPYYAKKGSPSESHKIIYDSTSETLEPLYFWILDFMNDSMTVEKIVDNFTSSPGSGHFGELGQRATVMQQQGMSMMAQINTVIKSIINLIYDLKEFQIRLSHYKASHSKNKDEAVAAILALKQMWMDNVDVKRGRGSINMLSYDMNFVTLRDAFMIAKSVEDVNGMDLNDRVKRILKPRLQEFLEWKKRSETELLKRYEIEKTYLKSQVNSLKLYTRWAKPYLVAAEKLKMKETSREPETVNVFNTILLQLTLLGKSEIKVEEAAINKDLPEDFKKLKSGKDHRKYYSCVLVDFVFRGIPQRVTQGQHSHFAFGGRVEITFKGYCLNKEELDMLNQKLDESDIADALNLIEKTTTESLDQLKEDIESFINEEEVKAKTEEKEEAEDVNPFAALFGLGKKKKEEKKGEPKKIEKVKPDKYIEKVIRAYGEDSAINSCFRVFDIYKKAHGMESQTPAPDFEFRERTGGL